MAEYTEVEKNYLDHDGTSMDSAMLYKELKAVRAELAEVKANTSKEPTKQDVMSIKDTNRRLKAIEENSHLFQGMMIGGKIIE